MDSIFTREVAGLVLSAIGLQAGATWLILKFRINGAIEDIREMKADQKQLQAQLLPAFAELSERTRLLEARVLQFPCVRDPASYWGRRSSD